MSSKWLNWWRAHRKEFDIKGTGKPSLKNESNSYNFSMTWNNGIVKMYMDGKEYTHQDKLKFESESWKYKQKLIHIYWNTTCNMTRDYLEKNTDIDFKKEKND